MRKSSRTAGMTALAVALLLLGAGAATAAGPAAAAAADTTATAKAAAALPKLIDLGADKCIPCKKMAPLLVELRADYAGLVDVEFIDVWKDKDDGEPYHLRLIPTQVFLDREGKEVFRHEGFFPREDIEKVFKDKFGVDAVPPGKGKA